MSNVKRRRSSRHSREAVLSDNSQLTPIQRAALAASSRRVLASSLQKMPTLRKTLDQLRKHKEKEGAPRKKRKSRAASSEDDEDYTTGEEEVDEEEELSEDSLEESSDELDYDSRSSGDDSEGETQPDVVTIDDGGEPLEDDDGEVDEEEAMSEKEEDDATLPSINLEKTPEGKVRPAFETTLCQAIASNTRSFRVVEQTYVNEVNKAVVARNQAALTLFVMQMTTYLKDAAVTLVHCNEVKGWKDRCHFCRKPASPHVIQAPSEDGKTVEHTSVCTGVCKKRCAAIITFQQAFRGIKTMYEAGGTPSRLDTDAAVSRFMHAMHALRTVH